MWRFSGKALGAKQNKTQNKPQRVRYFKECYCRMGWQAPALHDPPPHSHHATVLEAQLLQAPSPLNSLKLLEEKRG